MNFDSKDELYFSYWLEELDEFILGWESHPDPFKLFDGLSIIKQVQLKTKVKQVEKTLLQPHVYTPDFFINVTHNFPFKKHIISNYIEIKPKFDRYNMTRLFHINQKWVFDKFGIYVQQIIVDTLFKQTFVPRKCAFLKNGERGKRFEKCELL